MYGTVSFFILTIERISAGKSKQTFMYFWTNSLSDLQILNKHFFVFLHGLSACLINIFIYSQTSVSAFNGLWHHICVTWEKTSGSWKFYKDGDMKGEGTLKRGHTIGEGGTLVLGQDQDSVGGDFEADQSFQGMLSNVNVWDEMLSPTRITEMATSCLLDEWNAGNVYKWRNFLNEAETKLVKPSSCQPLGTSK